MITRGRGERQKELFQSALLPEFLLGKFKEKDWGRFLRSVGVGDPKEEYTKEDRQRDIDKANLIVDRVKATKYERAV